MIDLFLMELSSWALEVKADLVRQVQMVLSLLLGFDPEGV